MNILKRFQMSALIVLGATATATDALYAQAHLDSLRAPITAMILDFFALTLIGGIVGIIWLLRKEKKRRADAILDDAWNEVLNDPHYSERRHAEEQKRAHPT